MSSIDERIVIIKFDNDQFEKNVAQSSNTLDKLKEKLKLDGATKGLEAVSASAKSFSFGPIGEAVDSLRARFSTLGVVGMTVVSNLTNKITDFATKVGGQIISGGIRRAQNLEQANFMLEGLFGDMENKAEKVQEIMTAANNAVSGTAYGLDEAAKVASQLVASGIQDGEKMEFVLRGIAGTAAMTGGSYEELGNIFTTVAGSGKLMTEQLRQFEHRGLNVAATLAKELGTTEVEIREMVHDGEIDFETFSVALANAFGEHAQEANKTFAGSLSNVKAALSRLGAKVATPELQNLRDIFNVLAPTIDAVSKALQPLIDLLNNGLRKATNRGVEALTTFFLAFGGDAETLVAKTQYMSDEAKAHMNSTIAKFAEVQGAGGNFFTKLREKITGTSELVTTSADDIAKATDDIGMSAEEIDEYANRVIRGEFGNVPVRQQQLEELGVSFELVQNRVNELLGCEKRYEVSTEAAGKATNKTTTEMQKLSTMEKKLSGTTEDVVEKTENAASPLENLGAAFGNILNTLKTIGKAIGGAFTNVFSVNDFTEAVSFLADGFRKLTEKFKLSDKAANGLQTVFEGIFTIIRYGLIGLGKLIELGGKALGLVGTGIGKILEKIVDLRTKLATNQTWQKFWASMRSAAEAAGEKFQQFKDRIKSAIEQLKNTEGFQKLQSALGRLWEIIKELAGSALGKLTKKFAEFAGTKADFSWLDTIVDFLGKAAGKLADFIQSFIDGTNPIQTFFGNFKQENTGKFERFVNFLTTAKDAIADFFKGLFGGENAASIGKTGGFSGLFTNLFDGLLSSGSEFFKNLSTSDFIQSVKEFFSGLFEKVKDIDWEAVIETITDIGTAIAKLALLIESIKALKSAKGALDSAAFMFGSIGNFFNPANENSLPAFLNEIKKNWKRTSAAKILGMIALDIAAATVALLVLSKIPKDDLLRSVLALSTIMAEIAVVFIIIGKMKLNPAQMSAFGTAMAGLGVGIGLLALTAKGLSKMKNKDFVNGAAKVATFIAMIAIAVNMAGNVKAAAAFMGIALAVDLLIPAILILGHLKWPTILKAAAALGMVMAEISLAVGAVGHVKAAAAFMGIAVAIDLLVPAILILGNMPFLKMLQGALALVGIMLALAGAIKLASSPVSSKGATNILKMTVPLIAAIVGLKLLADIPWKKLLAAASAMTGVVMSLALALKLAKGGGNGAKNMLAMSVPLVAAIVGLAVLAKLPIKNLLVAALTLGGVMTALALALKLAGSSRGNKLSQGAKNMLAMSVPLVAAIVGLAVLAKLPIKNVLASALALGGVMLALAAAVKLATTVPKDGILMVLAMTVPLGVAAYALYQLAKYPWQNIMAAAVALGITFVSLSASIAILAAVPFMAGLSAIGLMAAMFAALVVAVAIMGKLFGEGGKFQGLMEKAIPVMEDFGAAIGGFIGHLIEGIGEGVAASIERLGEALGKFGESIGPFIEAAKTIDSSVLAGIGDLTLCLLEITGAEFLDALASGFGLADSSFERFGKQLVTFGAYLKVFAGQVDPAAVQNAVDGANIAAGLYGSFKGSGIFGGVLGWFQNGMGNGPLVRIGKELANFSEATAGIQSVNETSIKSAATAASSAMEMYKGLKGSTIFGGVLGWFQSGMGGGPLSRIGKELKAFSEATTGMSSVSADTITEVAGAASAAIEAYKSFSGSGVMGGFIGTIKKLFVGSPMKTAGQALAEFAKETAGIQSVDSGTVADVAAAMPDAVAAVAHASVADISDKKVGNFIDALESAGKGLSTFSSDVSSVLTGKMQSVAKVVPDLVSMTNRMSWASTDNVTSYADTLSQVGEKLASFGSSVSSINTGLISSVADSVAKIATIQSQMKKAGDAVRGSFSKSMTSAASDGVKNLVGGLSNGTGKVSRAAGTLADAAIKGIQKVSTEFKTAGTKAGSEFTSGIKAAQNSAYLQATALAAQAVKGVSSVATSMQNYGASAGAAFVKGVGTNNYNAWSAANTVANSAANGVNNNSVVTSFENAGKYAMDGLIRGLLSKAQAAYNHAANIANNIINRIRSAFNINSPSKVMIGIGESVIEGFVVAFRRGRSVAGKAGEGLAHNIIDGVSTVNDLLQNAIDLDIDANPTITPILDLSNIQKGAGLIGTMLGRNTPQLALAGAGAFGGLQSMVQSRTPQTDNGDVVHAINGLRDSMGNTTFNITVDGSTSPEEFVSDVVRILKNRSRI